MGDLGKLIVAKGFKSCSKSNKSPNLVTLDMALLSSVGIGDQQFLSDYLAPGQKKLNLLLRNFYAIVQIITDVNDQIMKNILAIYLVSS